MELVWSLSPEGDLFDEPNIRFAKRRGETAALPF
jgi:hypothetical protein